MLDSPGKNSGVGCHAYLQGSSWPRDGTQVSHIAGRSLLFELPKAWDLSVFMCIQSTDASSCFYRKFFQESYCQSANVVSLQMNPCGNGWWAMIFVLAILILGGI